MSPQLIQFKKDMVNNLLLYVTESHAAMQSDLKPNDVYRKNV